MHNRQDTCVCMWASEHYWGIEQHLEITFHRICEWAWHYETPGINVNSPSCPSSEPEWGRCSTPRAQRIGSSMLWTGVWMGWDKVPQQRTTGMVRHRACSVVEGLSLDIVEQIILKNCNREWCLLEISPKKPLFQCDSVLSPTNSQFNVDLKENHCIKVETSFNFCILFTLLSVWASIYLKCFQ